MVLPLLEAAHFTPVADLVVARPWEETEDPIRIVADIMDGASIAAVSDETWARFVIDLQNHRAGLGLQRVSPLMAELRMRKEPGEVAALRAVGACVDDVLGAVQSGELPLVGRTERNVALEIDRRLLESGHDTAEFHIVASGPNAASPHHEPGSRVIGANEVVLFDIGGRKNGYSSDSTRCVATGPVSPEITEAYAVLQTAQAAAADAARVGATCQDVDRAARSVIEEAGWGAHFIHRTGHGIGVAGHEEPYIVEGNDLPLEPGFAFSVEPGIYVDGKWGIRIEDIIVVTESDPIRCNQTTTDLVVLT
jgi:Xaa-Pro dipeptidase